MKSFFEWYASENECSVNWAKAELLELLSEAGEYAYLFNKFHKLLMSYHKYFLQQTKKETVK